MKKTNEMPKRQTTNHATAPMPMGRGPKRTLTFLASECGEFHGMGECIECTSLKEAFRHYQRFCKRSPQMVPSLEFSLHHADDPLYNEGEYPLATGEKGKELLSYVPYYANHPLVQEAVRELEKLEEQKKRQKKQSRER